MNKEISGKKKPDPARDRYAAVAGEKLREATDCRFSFLPYAALVQTSASWYAAAAVAMLRGNYGPVEDWVRDQARIAADQGYELNDLLQLMRLCRQIAIEKEGWVEDQMEAVDEVIDEALAAMSGEVIWIIPEGLQYVTGMGTADREAAKVAAAPAGRPVGSIAANKAEPDAERRIHKRAYLKLPIRVRGWAGEQVTEVIQTVNVARGGLYFITKTIFAEDLKLNIVYPYWKDSGEVPKEFPAEIVRTDPREDGIGYAIKFLVSLSK